MSALGVGDLTQRVAALEQAIAGLQGSEALSPNYMTVTPGGLVGADFTGLVNALGLVLPTGQGGAQTGANEINWQDATGFDTATMISVENVLGVPADGTVLFIQANAPTGASSEIIIEPQNGTATPAVLVVNQNPSGSPTASVYAIAGTNARVFIDSNGASSFLQLAAPAASSSGTGTLAWAGASDASAQVILPYGSVGVIATAGNLSDGSGPVVIQASPSGGGAIVSAITRDGHIPAASVNVGFSWIAWD